MRDSSRAIGLMAAGLALALLAPAAPRLRAGSLPDPPVGTFRSIVEETAEAVAGWERPVRLLPIVGLVAGVAMLVAAAFRRSRCGYCQPLASASGLLLCLLSLVAGRELDRQFENHKYRAESLIDQMRRQLRDYVPTLTAEDRRQWRQELLERLRELGSLAPDAAAGSGTLDLAGPVSAESPAPSWVTAAPASESGLFFVGSARSRSLDGARRASLDEALAKAVDQITSEYTAGGRRRSDPLDPSRLQQYIRQAAVTKATWFTCDAQTREFRYYTLLGLSRLLARPGVVRAFANGS